MGGEEPATGCIEAALSAGKPVVTANKEVMAKNGPMLLRLAEECGAELRYEASVGGGIPIIGVLQRDLQANDVASVRAIINGTTNYMITAMSRDGKSYEGALTEAQRLGYAEADPTSDVDGIDAAYKLAILASLAFHSQVGPQDVYRDGIRLLTARDFVHARDLGYAIRMLATARQTPLGLDLRVHPTLVSTDDPMAGVEGVLNAVAVAGDPIGSVVLEGPGAGAGATSSAVVADILDVAGRLASGQTPRHLRPIDQSPKFAALADIHVRTYLRLEVPESGGCAGRIGSSVRCRRRQYRIGFANAPSRAESIGGLDRDDTAPAATAQSIECWKDWRDPTLRLNLESGFGSRMAVTTTDPVEGADTRWLRLEESIAGLRNRTSELAQSHVRDERELNNLDQRMRDLEGKAISLASEIGTAMRQLDELNALRERVIRFSSELDESKELTEASIRQMRQEVDGQRESGNDANRRLQSSEKGLNDLRERLAVFDEAIRRVNTEGGEIAHRLSQIENGQVALGARISANADGLRRAASEENSLETRVEALERQLFGLTERVDLSYQNLRRVQETAEQWDDLRNNVEALRGRVEESLAGARCLQGDRGGGAERL